MQTQQDCPGGECPESFNAQYIYQLIPDWFIKGIMEYLEWKTDCWGDDSYPRYYLTTFVFLVVVVGIPPNLFALTVIGWFPDLSEKPKHICQAYSLLCNLLSLCISGFVILSTFVPTIGTCSVVLCTVHYCLFTTFFAELLSHVDYYIAIVWPFFHEEHFRVEDRTLKMCVLSAVGSIGAITGFYMNGVLDCRDDNCPSLVTMAMTKNGYMSTFVLVAFVFLWLFMLMTSLHVFCIAIKTSRNNAVAPAGQVSDKQEEIQIVQENVQRIYAGIKKKMTKENSKISSFVLHVSDQKLGSNENENDDVLKAETGEGTSRNGIVNERIEERHVPNEGHNDLDEGFIDECESTHSNPRVFEKSPSGSQDIPEPNVSMIIPENAGPNKALLKSAGRAFRYSLIHVLTYGMLIIPSLGYIICENSLSSLVVVSELDLALQNTTANFDEDLEMLVPSATYSFCKPDNMFFPRPLWQYMLLLFACFRVAYPFILIKSDSYLRQKINFIVSDDFEE